MTGEYVIVRQRDFHAHFTLGRNDTVSDRKSRLLCVDNSKTTGSSIKRNPAGKS